jgi:HAD superfamily hydrolase (TIGR01490 family)
MAIAFFDLDRTLIARNSGALWVRRELLEGRVPLLGAARAATWLLRYQAGDVDLEHGLRLAIGSLRGQREADLVERTARFHAREVRSLYRPGGRAAVEAHREAGDRLVLLTSASAYLGEHVRRDLGLDDVLGHRFEVDAAGRFTGEPAGPLCYGDGKRQLAAALAGARGVALADCAFYTDSMADLPALEAMGAPRVVHPDRRLRRVAEARGWPVLDWGEPPR